MPELVNNKVASPPGTSDMDGTTVCPCSTKKSMNVWRISLPLIFLVIRTPGDLPLGHTFLKFLCNLKTFSNFICMRHYVILELYQDDKICKTTDNKKVPNLL